MDTTPSRDELLTGLRAYDEEVDGVPTVRGMRNEGPYSPHYYKAEFGSWHDALRAADIQPTHGVEPDATREELLTALRDVDERTDRPPRRTDVDEHGEYPYILYDEEFESFVHALEDAGIDPDEKQYRFSSVDTPPEKQGSANVQKLREEGPTPASALPQGRSMKDREHGMWKFTIGSGATKQPDSIYYLNGEHAPELVIRRFFRQNPHVLEYRDPHGIKMAIHKHRPSWKDIGTEIVDELVAEGAIPEASFENLVVVRVDADETLRYCFERSVASLVNVDEMKIDGIDLTGERPIWGFATDHEAMWQALSERDGILFETRPGTVTHYLPVRETVRDTDVMTDLWVEYEDGIRSGGIDQPWPYLVVGGELHELDIPERELVDEFDVELSGEPIQRLDETALESFSNRYGGFESYLRDRDRSGAGSSDIALGDDPTSQDVLETLLGLSIDELPLFAEDSRLEAVDRDVRETAFRNGIYEIYEGCAICGNLFESPNGEHNLEAAHILPKASGGPDVLQNGLALCSRHHWAFDQGWFEIGENYEIRVREYPSLAGYDEFHHFDGESLRLPKQESLRPHPKYIRERNREQDD